MLRSFCEFVVASHSTLRFRIQSVDIRARGKTYAAGFVYIFSVNSHASNRESAESTQRRARAYTHSLISRIYHDWSSTTYSATARTTTRTVRPPTTRGTSTTRGRGRRGGAWPKLFFYTYKKCHSKQQSSCYVGSGAENRLGRPRRMSVEEVAAASTEDLER